MAYENMVADSCWSLIICSVAAVLAK